jgi:hypothetical protein
MGVFDMREVADVANELSQHMAQPDKAGVILYRDTTTGECTDVFISGTDHKMLATLASAIDEHPVLIGLLVNALGMVRKYGTNRDDEGFGPVIFAGEGVVQ